MGFKDLHLKFKSLRTKRFVIGDGEKEKKQKVKRKKASWMMPISYGMYVVEDNSFVDDGSREEADKVVAQREQIKDNELWFFGVFDATIGDGITKYMQSHLFDKQLKESQMRSRSMETMRKAHLNARGKVGKLENSEEIMKWGSAAAVVINGEKLVIANMGEYRVVVCRDGDARPIKPQGLLSGVFQKVKSRLRSGNSPSKGSELVVGYERVDNDTEFVILGSIGIWKVMREQEAVSLISHIEDPQEAAECLAREASNRMSKTNISCLIIRFDQ